MAQQSKAFTLIGWILSVLPCGLLLFSGAMKLQSSPEFLKEFTDRLGYPAGTAAPIGIAEIASTLLFLIPRTSVLGAVLLTGYLGGAVATHVRAGDGPSQFLMPAIFGAVVWFGLFFRDARIRALLPLRACPRRDPPTTGSFQF